MASNEHDPHHHHPYSPKNMSNMGSNNMGNTAEEQPHALLHKMTSEEPPALLPLPPGIPAVPPPQQPTRNVIVHLGVPAAVFYIEDADPFQDVRLVSVEGRCLYVNTCILASLSPLCRQMVQQVYEDPFFAGEDFRMATEFPFEMLKKLVHFAKYGSIVLPEDSGVAPKDVILQDKELLDCFWSFGVRLDKLELTPGFEPVREPLRERPIDDDIKPSDVVLSRMKVKNEPRDYIEIPGAQDPANFYFDATEDDNGMPRPKVEMGADVGIVGQYGPHFEPGQPIPQPPKPAAPKRKKKSDANGSSKKKKKGAKDAEEEAKKTAAGHKIGRPLKSNVTPGSPEDHLFYFPMDESLRDKSLPFQCDLCCRGFDKAVDKRQHIRRHKNPEKRHEAYFCFLCDEKPFATKFEYKHHQKLEHQGKEVQCHLCDFKTLKYGKMEAHVEKHFQNFLCKSCGKDLKSFKSNLIVHMKHGGKYHDAKCRLCPELPEFNTWQEHKAHLDKHHGGRIQWRCGFCPLFFDTETQMNIHRRKCEFKPNLHAHNPEDTQICPTCGKTIYHKNPCEVKKHMEDFHGEHQIPCQKCGKIFKHPNSLSRHMLSHRTYTCDICGKSGALRKYKMHMLMNHTPDHQKPYICNLCGKGFGRKGSYEDHMNIHTGEKPYKCPYCPSAFANSGTQQGHIRGTHKQEKRQLKKH